MPAEPVIPQPDADVPSLLGAQEQQTEAEQLAEDGGPAGTGHPQVQAENQNGVQHNVYQRTGDDAHHGIAGTALETELVIQHEGSAHPWGAQQNHLQVGLCVGQNRLGGAKEQGQRL